MSKQDLPNHGITYDLFDLNSDGSSFDIQVDDEAHAKDAKVDRDARDAFAQDLVAGRPHAVSIAREIIQRLDASIEDAFRYKFVEVLVSEGAVEMRYHLEGLDKPGADTHEEDGVGDWEDHEIEDLVRERLHIQEEDAVSIAITR